jgi:hypothetical protein
VAAPANDQWQENEVHFNPPQRAAMPPTFIEATSEKEIQAMLKFGRDSNLPLQVTFASVIKENVSASITYPIEWEGCASTQEWFRARFQEAAESDHLSPLPALSRAESTWSFSLRKEWNAFRGIIHEQTESEAPCATREHLELPTLTLYGPRSQVKIRAFTMKDYEECMDQLYQGRFSDGIGSGQIPVHHRISPPPQMPSSP